METPPSECYSSCQLHACRTTGKNTQYKFHQRNNAAPGSKNIPWWQSMEHDPYHFNTYCTPPGWRTKATAALGMLSCTVFILIHKYSGCPNAHMWILGVKFRHRDYCYKSWSLKPLHRTYPPAYCMKMYWRRISSLLIHFLGAGVVTLFLSSESPDKSVSDCSILCIVRLCCYALVTGTKMLQTEHVCSLLHFI